MPIQRISVLYDLYLIQGVKFKTNGISNPSLSFICAAILRGTKKTGSKKMGKSKEIDGLFLIVH